VTDRPNILVIAGRRRSGLDALAAAHGVSHKALVPVAGEAMVGLLRTVAKYREAIGLGSSVQRRRQKAMEGRAA
jgi:hypothetical protein